MGIIISYGAIELENGRINAEYRKEDYQIDRIALEKTGRGVWYIMDAHHMPESYRVSINEHLVISLGSDPRGEDMYHYSNTYQPTSI